MMKWRYTLLIAVFLITAILLTQLNMQSLPGLLAAAVVGGVLWVISLLLLVLAHTRGPSLQRGSKVALGLAWVLVALLALETYASVTHYQARHKVAQALEDIPFASVQMDPEGFLRLDGLIGQVSADTLGTRLEQPDQHLLVINSPGGSLDAAMQMAKLVREHDLIVLVAGECSSACMLVANASAYLSALPSARFGFHQGSIFGTHPSGIARFWAQGVTDQLIAALRAGGIPESILAVAMQTPPDHMYYVSAERLRHYGVVKQILY